MLFERERLLQELQPEVDELRTALGESTASHAAEVQHGMQRHAAPPCRDPLVAAVDILGTLRSAHCLLTVENTAPLVAAVEKAEHPRHTVSCLRHSRLTPVSVRRVCACVAAGA